MFWCAVLALGTPLLAATQVAFLPFHDNVRLKEAWDLSVDIPRWFSTTVDSVGSRDSSVVVVAFDTVLKVIEENALSPKEYRSSAWIPRLASRLGADYIVSGTVHRFKVMKRTMNTEAPLNASTQIGQRTTGTGGITVMGGLQSYTAEIDMDVDIYGSERGELVRHERLSTEQKDGGFQVYFPFQIDTDEMNFYHMARSEFGSEFFRRSIVGAVMIQFTSSVTKMLRTSSDRHATQEESDTPQGKEYVSGTVLDRNGSDVYVDLGTKDNILQGEVFEVLVRDRPFLSAEGDTLGWSETAVGEIKIRFVKADHFSQATVISETGTIEPGNSVRVRIDSK